MGYCHEKDERGEHEGYAIGFCRREGTNASDLLRELQYPNDDRKVGVEWACAGCDCGWRSPRFRVRGEWSPYSMFLPERDEETVHLLWREHVLAEIARPSVKAARSALLTLLAVLLLGGCAGELAPATAEQEQATDIAIDEWELRFGFAPACGVERASLGWSVLPDVDAVKRHCGLGESVDACLLTNLDGESTIYVHSERGRYLWEAYAHELAHWLQRCGGRAPHGDPRHADPAVWPAFERALRHRLRAELPQ